MRATWSHDGPRLTLDFALEASDRSTGPGQGASPVRLLHHQAHVTLPLDPGEIHPDLEALSALFVLRPWIGRRLVLSRGVSPALADMVSALLKIDVEPVDSNLQPRRPGEVLGLSYSSGYDSIAASELLPPDTPYLHHRRVTHPSIPARGTSWRADAFERLAQEAGRRGRRVLITRADFEHLCHPQPTLPHWFGFGVGPLLLADVVGLGGLAMGGTLETFYMDMGRVWTGDKGPGKGIDPLAELVGLPISRPVLGVTEVGTMLLTRGSQLGDLARACPAGTMDEPCGVCAKCVRKGLLSAAVAGGAPPPHVVALPSRASGRAAVEKDPPVYMQAQLEFATARLPRDGWLEGLHRRLGSPEPAATSWMTRAYPPAVERGVPASWRADVANRLEATLGWMDDSDVAAATSWRAGGGRTG